jgi:ketosteroid isomerase-like protein
MSHAIVRWKIEPITRSRRGLDERLLLSAPWVVRVLIRILAGRAADSRIRRELITRVIRVGFAANNRLDYDSVCAFFDPAAEIRLVGGAARIDLDPVYRGHAGLRKLLADWKAGFEQFRFEPREVIDSGGDRFGVLVEYHGQISGTATHQVTGNVFILRDGLAVRQDIYWDSEQVAEALLTPAH